MPQSPTPPKSLSAVIRVSRVNGRKGEKFMSPKVQRETIAAWAKAHGITIVNWYEETDKSGKTTNREGLKAAMAEVAGGRSDGIIVAKVDRFARNGVEGLVAVGELRKGGKAFVAVNDGIHGGAADDTPTGRMMLTILFAIAQWVLESLTDGWNTTRERHIAAGIAGQTPYGYRRNGNRRLVPDPETAPVVERIFEMRADAVAWTEIADILTADGIATPLRLARERWEAAGAEGDAPAEGGVQWTPQQVRKMLVNRTYLGELRSGGPSADDPNKPWFVNPAAHDAIITADLWERAQQTKKTPPPRGKGCYLLAGIVRCAGCGNRMKGSVSRHKAADGTVETTRYYRCRRRYSGGMCPAPASVNAEEIEGYVTQRFVRDVVSEEFVANPADGEIDAAAMTLRDAEQELARFLQSPATAEMGRALGNTWIETGQSVRVKAVVAAREGLATARAAILGASLPGNVVELWGDPDVDDETRRMWLSLTYAVVAVKRGRSLPAAERARIWATNDPSAPDDLPGRTSTRLRVIDV
jgi:site-specific DNA recombinase